MRRAVAFAFLATLVPPAGAMVPPHLAPEAISVLSGNYTLWGYTLRDNAYMRDECNIQLTDTEADEKLGDIPLFVMSVDTPCVTKTFGDRGDVDFKLWTLADGGGIILVADPKKPETAWRFANTMTIGYEYEHEFEGEPNKVLAILRQK